ncbi:hypothetical protein [[Clostridium] innocuum]|uniref:hypothetical protein n=1 Tax=Clostridium innocuum TaxID=1522 RepID=UPI000D6C9DA5|nr:hypothetical protein [[Clostridium] innocuum]PWJ15939.1 hypothetical protein ATF84_10736 [[Clostridium] innocuum]SSA44103.1 hypothetical protein SAMN04487929_10736 [[Clostridium] innocuum]
MKQKLSWILEGFFLILLLLVTILIYVPEQSEHLLHIRMIQVTGKNKEKAIEQDSLIFVKTFKENEEPKNNTLISFRAERFGESVILTHMFVKSEVRNQETFYITQAPDSSYYDTYETRHEDLVGSYLFHIKYMGRVYEFLQSSYGKITYAVVLGVCILSTMLLLIKGVLRERKGKAGIEVSAKKNALDPDQRSVDEKKEDTRGQEVKPDAEKPLLKTPKEDISRQAKGTEDKTAKAEQQAAADSILQEAGTASKQHIPKQTGKQRLRKCHALKTAPVEQRKAADDEELLPIVYKQKHQKPAGPTKIQQEIQEHPDAEGKHVQRSENTQESLVQHTSSGKSKPEQTIDLREGGATFTQAELQDILIAINTNEEESDQDTATASPAEAVKEKKEQYQPNEHNQLHIQAIGILEPVVTSIQETLQGGQYPLVEENPVETEDPSSDPDEVMVENDEIAEKEFHEEEQVTANDVYTADAGVDKELLEEVRKEVQELLHGVKAPQRVEAEQQEYPDFNRKYDINKSRQTDVQEEMPEPEEIEKSKVEEAPIVEMQEEQGILLKDMEFDCSSRFAVLTGRVINKTPVPVRYIKAEIELYDDFRNVIKTMKWYLCGRDFLQPEETRVFSYTAYEVYGVYDYKIRILNWKQK